MLPVSYGLRGGHLRSSASKMTRREQVLVSVVVVLGLAVWCLAMYSSPSGSELPNSSQTVPQSTLSDSMAEVVPRRLSDAKGGHPASQCIEAASTPT